MRYSGQILVFEFSVQCEQERLKPKPSSKALFYLILKFDIWKVSSRRAEKDAIKQKVLSFNDDGQKRNMVVKIKFTLLPHCNNLPFFKGFKKITSV